MEIRELTALETERVSGGADFRLDFVESIMCVITRLADLSEIQQAPTPTPSRTVGCTAQENAESGNTEHQVQSSRPPLTCNASPDTSASTDAITHQDMQGRYSNPEK
jgi:hypothetical protein